MDVELFSENVFDVDGRLRVFVVLMPQHINMDWDNGERMDDDVELKLWCFVSMIAESRSGRKMI